MVSYQTAHAPARSGGIDVAAWALVALIVALVCAAAGWAIARQSTPSTGDVARNGNLSARTGQLRGEAVGFSQGAKLGRREAALRARTQMSAERRTAAREGYEAGYAEGRMKAGDPDAYMSSSMGASADGGYPASGYEDVLANELLASDAPGYSDSAYDSLGYGASASTPYISSSAATTSPGDETY